MMLPTKEEWTAALARRHGSAMQERLQAATVAVCGLGGLGSNLAVLLTRAGVGRLILTDFDRVDLTNLHRQQYKLCQIGLFKTEALSENLREISPYTKLVLHNVRLTEENAAVLLQDADIVCEAFDDPTCKAMLTDTVLTALPDKYLVAASGMAGLDSANTIRTRQITGHFYLCGDGVSELQEGGGLYASRVALCAAHQAHAVLRILAGRTDV